MLQPAHGLDFRDDNRNMYWCYRHFGQSVRPATEE